MQNKFFGSKLNSILLLVLIILMVIALYVMFQNKETDLGVFEKKISTNDIKQVPAGDTKYDADPRELNYIYQNHGFTIELPKGYIPHEEQSEGGPAISISLPTGNLAYVTDASFWEKYSIPSYVYLKDQKIGETVFKVYTYSGATFYWFKKGNVGYEFGGTDTIGLENLLKTFKFVGWPQEKIPEDIKNQILGNKDDLTSFSIWPNTKVHGVVSYRGVINKGGYFFEANILINILDQNKKVLKRSNAVAKTDWMTQPVSFEGNIDFTGLPKGKAYFEIHNDNPSDLRENDKSILIPIIIN